MTSGQDAALAVARTYREYLALGNETVDGPHGCRVVRNDAAEPIHDANHLQPAFRPGEDLAPHEVADLFAFLDEQLGERTYRCVATDDSTAPAALAHLGLHDYVPAPALQMLLEGELLGPAPPPVDLRPVQTASDWRLMAELIRLDHLGVDARLGTQIFTPEVTAGIVVTLQSMAPEVRFQMVWVQNPTEDAVARVGTEAATTASASGEMPVAYFSGWPGVDGVGMVEDLYTLPDYRHRGIARALIHHCVGDARARGADRVLIGAYPDDTPKHFYAALGFRPACLTWSWVSNRKPGASEP